MKQLSVHEGDVLEGRYRLQRHLGRGGFGDVWEADELLPGGTRLRSVALKLLRAPLDSSWAEEARIIASLRHPALVTIYAAGVLHHQHESFPYVAMELLTGTTLDVYTKTARPPAWRRILAWARSTAAALDSIHAADIVHLDLKPSNLFLRTNGSLVVLDFGIATRGNQSAAYAPLVDDEELSTEAFLAKQNSQQGETPLMNSQQIVCGTPGYMAPEIMAEGEATPAADAFALACCIVHLATGELPHDVETQPHNTASGTTPSRAQQLHSATLQGNMRDVDAMPLPVGLRQLVKRWLQLDPAKRLLPGSSLSEAIDEVWARPFGRQPMTTDIAPHDSQHEGQLVGRQGDCDELSRALARSPCIILEGRSGSGLTSLALAGVIPALGKRFVDHCDDWEVLRLDSTGSLLQQVHTWLDGHEVPPNEELGQRLRIHRRERGRGVVVFLDGLQAASKKDRREFEELLPLAEVPPCGLRLLATKNATSALIEQPTGQSGVELRSYRRPVGSVNAAHAEALVRGLAPQLEVAEQTRLADEVQSALETSAILLPYTVVALRRLNRLGSLPTKDGALMSTFIQHCDEFFRALSNEEQRLCLPLMTRMTQSDGHAVELDTLAIAAEQRPAATAVLTKLARGRILYQRNSHFGLLHPDLGKAWPKLRDHRLHNLDSIVAHETLSETAARWQLRPDSQLLYRGQQLDVIRSHYTELYDVLTPHQRAFIEASIRAKRTSTLLRIGALVAAILSLILVWRYQRENHHRAAAERARTRKAVRDAAVGRMVARSLRTSIDHERIALLGTAISNRRDHSTMALDLFEAARGLPPVHFLQRRSLDSPQMAWKSDWLLGRSADQIVFFDLRKGAFVGARVAFRPHHAALRDFKALAHGDAIVTRSIDGELKVWKLNQDRPLALAARSPMRCPSGPLLTSRRAPIIVCSTGREILRWDLRSATQVSRNKSPGNVSAISDHGDWIAVTLGRSLMLWHGDGPAYTLSFELPVKVVSFSPRDPVVAVALRTAFGTKVKLFSMDPKNEPTLLHQVSDPAQPPGHLFWHENGLDIALCSRRHKGVWHYLRKGGRAQEDGPAPPATEACRRIAHGREQLVSEKSYADILQQHNKLKPRHLHGSWRLKDGRIVSRNIGILDTTQKSLDRLLHYRRADRVSDTVATRQSPSHSVARFARNETMSAWQLGNTVELHSGDRKLVTRQRGHLLGSCPDGKFLAWRKGKDSKTWDVFMPQDKSVLVRLKRFPGRILGTDAQCQRIFFQDLSGKLLSAEMKRSTTAIIATALKQTGGSKGRGGYVFMSAKSEPTAKRSGGLWIALSSGRILRLDGRSNSAKSFGVASSRATAMADGPGESIVFADSNGLQIRYTDGRTRSLMHQHGNRRQWSDLLLLKGGKLLLAARRNAVSLIDVTRGELLRDLSVPDRDRLGRWDKDGNVLSWTFATNGHPEGEVLPLGRKRALAIADAASNLRTRLGEDGSVEFRLR